MRGLYLGDGYIITTLYPHFGNITVLYIHVYFRGKQVLEMPQNVEFTMFDGLELTVTFKRR